MAYQYDYSKVEKIIVDAGIKATPYETFDMESDIDFGLKIPLITCLSNEHNEFINKAHDFINSLENKSIQFDLESYYYDLFHSLMGFREIYPVLNQKLDHLWVDYLSFTESKNYNDQVKYIKNFFSDFLKSSK